MQVPALSLDHPLVSRIERSTEHDLIERYDSDSELTVRIESIKLAHEGDEKNFRPYVRIKGELQGIKPTKRLPGAVSEITYAEGAGLSIDARCDFSDDQIRQMIEQGYFEPGYDFVDGIVGESIILNAETHFKISRVYDEKGLDVPIVFLDIPERSHLTYEPDMSGYDFTEYLKVPDKQLDLERVVENSVNIEHDLFAGLHDEFTKDEPISEMQFEADAPVVPVDDAEFEREREELRREMEANAPVVEPEEDEATRLYREHVEGSVKTKVLPSSERELDDEDEFDEGEARLAAQEKALARMDSHQPDLGDAAALFDQNRTSHTPTVDERESEVDMSDENDWLFSDVEDDEVDAPEFEAEPEDEESKHSDPASVESQSRVAQLLAEHVKQEQARVSKDERELPDKDVQPGL